MASVWKKLGCVKAQDLNLRITLSCGQAFRWKINNNGEWCGVLFDKVWTLKENEEGIFYKVYEPLQQQHEKLYEECNIKHEHILNNYFRLDVELSELYQQWSKKDTNFKRIASKISGFRLMQQDPVENLFSFICSSNNNIDRISRMVEALCIKYGEIICELDGVVYHSFPQVTKLAQPAVEQELRKMKFGYRAKFIHQTAKILEKKGNKSWLMSLRNAPYAEAHAALCQFPGVGSKVADCVCLMSLDKTDAIPVDTHVWQISLRDYDIPDLKKSKSLTNRSYRAIGDYFRQIFGKHAGWANSVLFSADLKKFQSVEITVPPSSECVVDKKRKKLKRKLCNSDSNKETKKNK